MPSWEQTTALPTPRLSHMAGVFGTTLVIAGGANATNAPPYTVLESRDVAGAGGWVAGASLLTGARSSAYGMHAGSLYLVAGNAGFSGDEHQRVQVYNGSTWAYGTDFPRRTEFAAAADVGGRFYVVGGTSPDDVFGQVSSRFHLWELVGGGWVQRANHPMTLIQQVAAGVNGLLYTFGGFDGFTNARTARCFAYNPATDTWAEKTAMPVATSFATGVLVNGKVWIVGGEDNVDKTAAVHIYDPATDTWATGPALPTARGDATASFVGGFVYYAGGRSTSILAEVIRYSVSRGWTVGSVAIG